MYKYVRGECPCIDNALLCTNALEVNVLVLIMHYYVQMRLIMQVNVLVLIMHLLCTNACNLNDCDNMQTASDDEEEFS